MLLTLSSLPVGSTRERKGACSMFLCRAERAAVTPLVQIGDSSYEATERTTACHVRIGRKC